MCKESDSVYVQMKLWNGHLVVVCWCSVVGWSCVIAWRGVLCDCRAGVGNGSMRWVTAICQWLCVCCWLIWMWNDLWSGVVGLMGYNWSCVRVGSDRCSVCNGNWSMSDCYWCCVCNGKWCCVSVSRLLMYSTFTLNNGIKTTVCISCVTIFGNWQKKNF